MARWALIGVLAGACTVIATPVTGSAASDGEQPIGHAEVEATGVGFTGCGIVDAQIESSGSGGVSGVANGNVSLSANTTSPLPAVLVDADLAFSAHLSATGSTAPGADQVDSGCADPDEPGDSVPIGSTGSTVAPEPVVAPPRPLPPERATVTVASAPVRGVASDPREGRTGADPEGSVPTHRVPDPDLRVLAETGTASPAPGTAVVSSGLLTGALVLAGVIVAAALLSPLAFDGWTGPEWVEANVRAVPSTSPPISTELTPDDAASWLPTLAVRFALHGDSGTQVLTEG